MSALSSHPLNHTFAHFPVKRSNGFTHIFPGCTLSLKNKESDWRDRHMRLLFVDYSAAFYTIVLCRLVGKLRNRSPNISTCSCILDLMTDRWWEWLVTLSPRWVGAWEHHRAVSSAHSCAPHTLMTAWPHRHQITLLSSRMTRHWWAWFPMAMSRHTGACLGAVVHGQPTSLQMSSRGCGEGAHLWVFGVNVNK